MLNLMDKKHFLRHRLEVDGIRGVEVGEYTYGSPKLILKKGAAL